MGAVTSTITDLPTSAPDGALFGGDQSNIDAWHFTVQSSVAASFLAGNDGFIDPSSNPSYSTNGYFNNELSPYLTDFQVFTGYSGVSTKLLEVPAIGQNIVQVRNSATLLPGMRLLIGGSELVTVNTVPNGTSFTTINPIAGEHAAGDFVAKGSRTHFAADRADVDGNGGGDYYAHTSRISLGNVKANNPDQTHFSYIATAGMFDGDATACSDGVYLQCSEFNIIGYNYQGNWDIAAIGDVRSYQRNNDTGTYGGVWVGNLQKSEGTKYCNAAYSVIGKWLGGIDLINADFGVNNAAIKLAPNQCIFFNGSSTRDEAGYNLWGADAGDTFLTYSAGLGQLQAIVGNVNVVSMTASHFYTATGVTLAAGGNVAIDRNNLIMLDGEAGNTYLQFNGTNVYLVTNGIVKQLN